MKIIKVASAYELEEVYDGLKRALVNLDQNFKGRTKLEIVRAIKMLERIRCHLKYKDFPIRGA